MDKSMSEFVDKSSTRGHLDSPDSAPLRLLGAGEIQELCSVGRIRTYQITCRRGFPEPVAELESGRIWLAEDVEEWIRINRPWNSVSAVTGQAATDRLAPVDCVTKLNPVGQGYE